MLSQLIPYALPFGLTLALASLLRLVGGPETGARLAGVALPAGFLAAWALFRGIDPAPRDVLDLALHIALGGALLGVALDALHAGRRTALAAAAVFALVCTWAAVDFPLHWPTGADLARRGVEGGLLLLAWALTLGRLAQIARHPEDTAEAVALLAGLAGGLALIAAAAGASGVTGAAPGDSGIARPALGLACAGLGLLAPLAIPAGTARLGLAGLLGGGGALLALGQALALVWPVTTAPLVVLGLGLFAGPTVRRLPGPPRLRPLWTLVLALACGGLGAALMLGLGPPA